MLNNADLDKYLLLDNFRRDLMFYQLDWLDLKNLDPLRKEIQEKLDLLTQKEKKGEN